MGFSLTGTHVIFFIASMIVAGTVSGIFIAITINVSTSLSERGGRVQEQLDTDFEIINDPDNIPHSGNDYLFYVKNIGGNKLTTTNDTFQVFIDGDMVARANYNFSVTSISPGEATTIYVADSELAAGDHKLRVVGPLAIDDEFTFTIS
jgi:flagellar protein FlaG